MFFDDVIYRKLYLLVGYTYFTQKSFNLSDEAKSSHLMKNGHYLYFSTSKFFLRAFTFYLKNKILLLIKLFDFSIISKNH